MNTININDDFFAKHDAKYKEINAQYAKRNRRIAFQFAATAAAAVVLSVVVYKSSQN